LGQDARLAQVVEVAALAGLSFFVGLSLDPDDEDEESEDGVDAAGVDESDDEPPPSPDAAGLDSAGLEADPPERLSVL